MFHRNKFSKNWKLRSRRQKKKLFPKSFYSLAKAVRFGVLIITNHNKSQENLFCFSGNCISTASVESPCFLLFLSLWVRLWDHTPKAVFPTRDGATEQNIAWLKGRRGLWFQLCHVGEPRDVWVPRFIPTVTHNFGFPGRPEITWYPLTIMLSYPQILPYWNYVRNISRLVWKC